MIIMTKEEYDRRVASGEFSVFNDLSGRFQNMNGRRAFFCHIPEHDCCGLLVEGVGFIVEGEEEKWPNPTRKEPLTASGVVSGKWYQMGPVRGSIFPRVDPLGDSGEKAKPWSKKARVAVWADSLRFEFAKQANSFRDKLEWLRKNPEHDYYLWELMEACAMLGRCGHIMELLSGQPGHGQRSKEETDLWAEVHEVVKNR